MFSPASSHTSPSPVASIIIAPDTVARPDLLNISSSVKRLWSRFAPIMVVCSITCTLRSRSICSSTNGSMVGSNAEPSPAAAPISVMRRLISRLR